ncbi:thioredoxin [Methylacidiphilum caldifontis]|uniref:Thioredoxin n=1 Tax=Methylacidiphilum caldifontis TaxID=2795386 RepID=A0A4Y8PB22_9BACT|nr:thioredoxin domain-containing protein [Methylacidiphilum caldifontis]TFE68183.1 thioredoxin [Methylacidiphilum caldifontis]
MNALCREKSPYLLQHANNPVDWQPWNEESLLKAKRLNKPIFLSIGYSTCHWCHVMAKESFENPTVAELLNAFFIPIKVDREERPDIDQFYMEFVQAFTGQGGWPLNVWLTPNLEPFFGGTYFPLESKWGKPGFIDILKKIAELWQSNRSLLEQQGEEILLKMKEAINSSIETQSPPNLTIAAKKAVEQLWASFDRIHGGFSPPPKFPRPSLFYFLFRAGSSSDFSLEYKEKSLQMALFSLQKMSCGGIHDQLEGGFHRYSVDAQWRLPHFEKMLYDQATLGYSYIEAYQITQDPLFKETSLCLFEYLFSHLHSDSGGFYSAEDADSLNALGQEEEGAYYLWTMKELEESLEPIGDKNIIEKLLQFFGATPQGNLPQGSITEEGLREKNILYLATTLPILAEQLSMSLEETKNLVAKAKAMLKKTRINRSRPFLDDKIICSWNGYCLSSLSKAYMVFEDKRLVEEAKKTASFLLDNLWDPENQTLYRIYRHGRGTIGGFSTDYASVAVGLLHLFEADQDEKWLSLARQFQEILEEKFRDPYRHTYLTKAVESSAKSIESREEYDGAEPATISLSAHSLLKLYSMTGEEKWRQRLEELFKLCWPMLERFPTALPYFLAVYNEYRSPRVEIIIVGEKENAHTRQLFHTLSRLFIPNRILLVLDPKEKVPALLKSADFYGSLTAQYRDQPSIYICADNQCQLAQSDVSKALEILKPFTVFFSASSYRPS